MPPYIGEIRMFAGTFAPAGWAMCDGQLYPISENDALFTLIGTTYGGDGEETFAVPNLAGRVVRHHNGLATNMGEAAGVETVTLSMQQIPNHSHPLVASTATALDASPAGDVLGNQTLAQMYVEDVTNTALHANAAPPVGGSQPHDNMQPYLGISFIISLFGEFPQQ